MSKLNLDFYNEEVERIHREAAEMLNQNLTKEQLSERQKAHTRTIAGLQSYRTDLLKKGIYVSDPLGAEGLGLPS